MFYSLSLIDHAMASKAKKSTRAWNLLRGSGSSFSDPPVPSHIRFRDEKANTNFFENFQNRGVHLELQVILSDFSNTALPEVIQTRGWESLCGKPERCPIVFIQEFYSNMHGINTSVPCFVTTFKGTHIVVTPDLISEVLHVPKVAHSNYPGCEHLRTVFRDELLSHFCETPST